MEFPCSKLEDENGGPRFCVDYRTLNKPMKFDRFSQPKVGEGIDDMAESGVFSKLDVLAGYWQIKLSESVQEKTEFCCQFESS